MDPGSPDGGRSIDGDYSAYFGIYLAGPGGLFTTPVNVMLEGQNIDTTSDSDELVFSDGTGEIVADYPSSNVPALNVRIRIIGVVASSEIDVSAGELI